MSSASRRQTSASIRGRTSPSTDPAALTLPPIHVLGASNPRQDAHRTVLPPINTLGPPNPYTNLQPPYHNRPHHHTEQQFTSPTLAASQLQQYQASAHRELANFSLARGQQQQQRNASFASTRSTYSDSHSLASSTSPIHDTNTRFAVPAVPAHVRTDVPPREPQHPWPPRQGQPPRSRQPSSGTSAIVRDYDTLAISATSRPPAHFGKITGQPSLPSALPPRTLAQAPVPNSWKLQIRQQPIAARACGFGERDRRVIDPPPILDLADSNGPLADVPPSLRGSMVVVHASLYDETGNVDVTAMDQPGRRAGGRLMGTLVASSSVAKDDKGTPGVFFAFPDLSCRSYGRYCLRFSLLVIAPGSAGAGTMSRIITHVTSEAFKVYSAKEFPGMVASTALTHALRKQGLNIPAKKGKQAKGSKDSLEGDSNDDDNDDDDDNKPEPSSKGKKTRK